MRPQRLICVHDVETSCRWYQRLLGCESDHGGPNYERLVASGKLVLQLHRWDVEHHHGPIGDPNDVPPGNGVILWFEIDDIDAAIARAEAMGVEVILPRHRNPPDDDGGPNHWEIWPRDPEGYKVVLASPDGTADGNWRPRRASARPRFGSSSIGDSWHLQRLGTCSVPIRGSRGREPCFEGRAVTPMATISSVFISIRGIRAMHGIGT